MNTVWKFKIIPSLNQPITMPQDASILYTNSVDGVAYIWALVNPTNPPVTRTFSVYGTGHYNPCTKDQYIGSFFIGNGILVFHLFETTK